MHYHVGLEYGFTAFDDDVYLNIFIACMVTLDCEESVSS